jgi:hypothetical protein
MVDFMLGEKRMVWFNDQWSNEPILSISGSRYRNYSFHENMSDFRLMDQTTLQPALPVLSIS